MTAATFYSVDCGGSTLDIIRWNDHLPQHLTSREIDSRKLTPTALRAVLEHFCRDANTVAITGGKSLFFPTILHNFHLKTVPEIAAIGAGGNWLFPKQKLVVVSMGTGTCLVGTDRKGNSQHLGGTGVGGGTLVALSKVLLGLKSAETIAALYNRELKSKVDLSVAEIIGGDLGNIPGHKTAANLAKMTADNNKAEIASGLVNLIAQSIGMTAVMAARYWRADKLVLSGKLTRLSPIVENIKETAALYDLDCVVHPESPHLTAIGAGLILLKNS